MKKNRVYIFLNINNFFYYYLLATKILKVPGIIFGLVLGLASAGSGSKLAVGKYILWVVSSMAMVLAPFAVGIFSTKLK